MKKLRSSPVILVALFTLLCSSSFAAKKRTFSDAPETMEAIPTMSAISVDGNRFVDEEGETIVFRGVAMADLYHVRTQRRWDSGYFEAAKSWNANIVRLAVHPKWMRDMGMQNYLKELDKGVRWAQENGMYVIIDWHTIGNPLTGIQHHESYETTREETFRFWYQIANRYKGNPTVAFYELWNEPTNFNEKMGRLPWSEFKAFMEELIYMIDHNDDSKIYLIAGFNWGYDLKYVEDAPIDHDRIAYVTHPYPQKRKAPWVGEWEKDWGFVAKKYPIIATEFGYMSASKRGAHVPVIAEDDVYAETLINFFEERGISWTPWVFDPIWTPGLIKDWDYNPTPQGEFFKKVMMEKNPK